MGQNPQGSKVRTCTIVQGNIRGVKESRSVSVESGDPGKESITSQVSKVPEDGLGPAALELQS